MKLQSNVYSIEPKYTFDASLRCSPSSASSKFPLIFADSFCEALPDPAIPILEISRIDIRPFSISNIY